MKYFFLGFFFSLSILLLPFQIFNSPRPKAIKFKKVSLKDFKLERVRGGTLRIWLSSDPKTLNPVLAQETTSTEVLDYLFVGLFKFDLKDFKVKPELAKSYRIEKGGRVIVVKLRDNLYWSDGKRITAEDVVFTYQKLYLNDKIPNSYRDMLLVDGKKIKVKKVNELTVKFILPKPFAPILMALTSPILPKHALEKYLREGNFISKAWNVGTEPKQIVVNGPYLLKEYLKGQRIVFEKNPYYYRKGLPVVKKIVAQIVQDPETSLLKFSKGEIDYRGVSAKELLYLIGKKGIEFYDLGETPSITFLALNQNPRSSVKKYKLRWFRNRLFRVALSYAIDRRNICKLVFNGLCEPLYTPITPANSNYYQEDYYPKYPYNPRKAKEILKELGFKDEDGDGVLEDKEGHPLVITLLTNSGNREREMMGNLIKEDLKRVGIKVIFRPIDFNTLVSKLTSPPYDWEAVIIGLTGSLDPHFGRNVWHSSGSLHLWNPSQKKPSYTWEREVDKLFDLASVEMDPRRRRELYKRAFWIISYQQPLIFLIVPKSLMASWDYLGNFYPTVWGIYERDHLGFKLKD